MGDMFKSAGYATAIYGKWHLGAAPESLPTNHGFDEFYGIPPDISWDSATYVDTAELTHSVNLPYDELRRLGPQIQEAVAGGPLKNVKPYTPEVRAEIDVELTAKSIDFLERETEAKKPFFLYLPFSMGHAPNLASKEFAGKSRIGNYGDKLMEGDHHVGEIFSALDRLGVADKTIVIFASDNGPWGENAREFGNQGTPDMGSPGPFRGELGEVTEGAIRTAAVIRWPGHIAPDTSSYAMFSIMDFLPTLADVVGAKLPDDRPIDGVDQLDVLLGKSATGHRESLLSFVGGDLMAARWKQWRAYFTGVHPTGFGPQRQPGIFSTSAPLAGYPIIYNIVDGPPRGSHRRRPVRLGVRPHRSRPCSGRIREQRAVELEPLAHPLRRIRGRSHEAAPLEGDHWPAASGSSGKAQPNGSMEWSSPSGAPRHYPRSVRRAFCESKRTHPVRQFQF